MATLQGKAVKNTYRQVLQIGANNVGVSASLQPVQDGAGVNTALSLSTIAATVNGDLTITGDLIITGGGIQIKDLIDDTVAALIQNGTGITWTYNDAAATLTGNFTGTTSVVPEGSNLYYTQGRFDSAFAAKSTTNLAEGTNLYFTEARGNANFATNLAASDTDDLDEGVTNLYFSNSRARLALSVTAGTGISYNNTTGVFNLAAIPNASLTNSSITINSQSVALGGSVTLTTTNIAEGTNLYWTNARFDSRFGTKTTTDLAEGTNLYYTQARFNTAFAAKTTTDLAEGTNLYYTDARSRLALSSSATGLSYANNSGVFSLTAGYAIPTTVKLGEYDIAYNRSIVSAAVTGTSTKTLSLTQQDANVITATWTDQGITTINGTANQIAATTVGNTTTLAFTNDVTMPNNLVVSGNLTINGTATYVNTESISSKDPLFEVANTNNTTDAVDIGYYGRYYDAVQERVEFTGLFRDASDAGKFKIFTGLVDEPTNVVNTTGTGYTVATLVANVDGNLNGTANAANILSTARTIAASGDAVWSVSFDGSANVSSALTLANTGVTATTYGTSTSVPTIAVDSKGRITSASNTNITFPVTTVNGFAGTVVLTTSDVAEGTNQYFTTARAQASITGGASSVVTANLTASRALVSDGSGKIAASATTTTTEIGYLAGVTSALQTQLNGKLNLTGGTLTGGLIGTTGSFSSSGSGDTFTIGHTSGSGIALNITKNGNGEGLYINKASGSGNAATIIGTLNATTLVKSGGTASQFLMADGSVNTSVLASGAYLPLIGGTLTGALNGTTATFSGNVSINANSARLTVSESGGAEVRITAGGSSGFIGTYSNHSLTFLTNSTNALTIASTGAATFNSSTSLSAAFNSTTNNPYIRFDQSGAAKLFIGERTAVSGSTGTGYDIYTAAGNDLRFFTNSSSNAALTIATTGAATFSSSVTMAYGGNPRLILQDTDAGAGNVGILFKESTNDKWTIASTSGNLQFFNEATASNALLISSANAATFSNNVTAKTFSTFNTVNPPSTGVTQGVNIGFDANPEWGWIQSCRNSASAGELRDLFLQPLGGNTAFGTSQPIIFSSTGVATFSNLAGTGSRAVIASSTGVLSAPISDISVKENITSIGYGLSEILKMNPVWFNFIDEYIDYGEGRQNGNIAQEMETIIPEAVFTTPSTGKMGINYDQLHAVYIKAIQELEARLKELEAK